MANYGRRKKLKRGQQIRRQLVLGTGLLALVIATIVGYNVQNNNKKNAEVKETTATVKKDNKKAKAVEVKKETLQEQIERIKSNAKTLQYPDKVIELLDKNTETVNFVEDYAKRKDEACADTMGNSLETGKIPQLLQFDERWGYAPYGTSIVAVSGCGPTCLSMVIAGLTGDATITPDKVAAYGSANGSLDEENNTLWTFMEQAPANWNVKAFGIAMDESVVQSELQAGHPIICSVTKGDFTQSGHFIVLTGYDNGSVTVNDPFSTKNSVKTWAFSEIKDQIKGMWAYSL